jgi:hypothetical protein
MPADLGFLLSPLFSPAGPLNYGIVLHIQGRSPHLS